jgi:hypothetical protein
MAQNNMTSQPKTRVSAGVQTCSDGAFGQNADDRQARPRNYTTDTDSGKGTNHKILAFLCQTKKRAKLARF